MLSALIQYKVKDRFTVTKINAIYTILFTSYFGNQGLNIFYNVNYDFFNTLKSCYASRNPG